MTHLWKSQETYTFDIPGFKRIQDVYGKNTWYQLRYYIRHLNPKVTDVQFDPYYAVVRVIIDIPKYPESHPYFTQEDSTRLLETYMDYANMSLDELGEFFRNNIYETKSSPS